MPFKKLFYCFCLLLLAATGRGQASPSYYGIGIDSAATVIRTHQLTDSMLHLRPWIKDNLLATAPYVNLSVAHTRMLRDNTADFYPAKHSLPALLSVV